MTLGEFLKNRKRSDLELRAIAFDKAFTRYILTGGECGMDTVISDARLIESYLRGQA